MNELFTIGHSNHTAERFVELLHVYSISVVVDVRSAPYSKYSPHFSKAALQPLLDGAGIQYRFLGRELGARREEEGCYVDGQAHYGRIALLPAFKRGVEHVLDVSGRERTALMCSEADPIECHRMILICRHLLRLRPSLRVSHILSDGAIETQQDAENRLVGAHNLQPELFGDRATDEGLIEVAYELQGDKIAYRTGDAES